jgi:hypothetical protein
MTQEALRMAHKALIGLSIKHGEMTDEGMDAIAAIKEALAKEKTLQALHSENERLGLYKDAYAEQEPMAWYCCFQGQEEGEFFLFGSPNSERYPSQYKTPLYEHLPQRTWVGLTDDEISELSKGHIVRSTYARAIEAKLKESNT